MRFLTPSYLLGALAIALPIVLHLLRRDVAPAVPFTAVRLLRGTPVERSRSRRLRDLLLLAARIAALLLLAWSFARPYLVAAAGRGGATVVVIDRSFSMGAPGVFARARVLAQTAIEEARRAGDRVALVAFDDRAIVAAPLGSAEDARGAVAAIAPGSGATRYAPALEEAAELLADEPKGRVVLVGDLQRSGFDGASPVLPESVRFSIRNAGGARSNLAVTDLRMAGNTPAATVRNYGTADATTRAVLDADGRQAASQSVNVPSGRSVDVRFALTTTPHQLSVSVDDASGYPADDRRFAVVSTARVPRVLIAAGGPVSAGGFFLSRALTAADGAPEFDVTTVRGGAFAGMSTGDVQQNAVVALLSTHGLDRRAGDTLRAYLGSGGGLLVVAAPDVDASVLSALLGWQPALAAKDADAAGMLTVSDVRHPIFRPFDTLSANLGQVQFQHAWSIDPGRAWRVLARFTAGPPALLERSAGAGRVLLFASDVDRQWNDFPLHPSFVPFIQEAVRYLGARAELPASYAVADVPAGVPPAPGITSVAGRTITVNVDPRESSLERVMPEEFERLITRSDPPARPAAERRAEEAEARQGYWRYGLMLMIGVLVAEAFVGSR